MAGARPGVHVLQLKAVEVPKSLITGEKVLKWEEDGGAPTPVTLKVDPNGFYLYWEDMHHEKDLLDIQIIRDTRTGKFARTLKTDSKQREVLAFGSKNERIEDKTLTVVYGTDMVNVCYYNFTFTSSSKENTAKFWADHILKIATNLLALHSSAITFHRKAYVKLCTLTDQAGRIPVKSIVKLFASSNKDDKKRVEQALDQAGLPSGRLETISPSNFQERNFFNFYKHLVQRTEVEKIFLEIAGYDGGSKKKPEFLNCDQLVKFLNEEQRDPRLNEILYPYADQARAMEIINQYEENKFNAQKGHLSLEGFLMYLMSADNLIVSPEKLDLSDDMDQPLSHYFINSSHNTYLTGHQFTGKSSVEIYRQCLLAGCRCVELDFWNGKEEPVIKHGYTMVPEIPAKDVIEAIAEAAFKMSPYPVVLSFENHCSPKQQAKIAQYAREIFGDALLSDPIDGFPLEPGASLPSPHKLKYKIIIKNKKKHVKRPSEPQQISEGNPSQMGNGDVPGVGIERDDSKEESNEAPPQIPNGGFIDTEDDSGASASDEEPEQPKDKEDGEAALLEAEAVIEMSALVNYIQPVHFHSFEHAESVVEKFVDNRPNPAKERYGRKGKQAQAGAEISALVNYVEPVRFVSFEYAEKRNRSYEMSSFVETNCATLLKENPTEFVNYNKRQLSRVYPKGTRVDSSNFMPQAYWNAGCQLVALNFQTLDLGMQLNLGIFEYNSRCGYLLKPDFMRRPDRKFDPFAESTVDGIIAGTVSVRVISGQFLSDKRASTFVAVDMFGLPADTKKIFKTKTVPNNGINPVYDEKPFRFGKVVLPYLATLKITVYEEPGRMNNMLGYRVIPVVALRPGYRHLSLRNESSQPLLLSTLFLHIQVKDYVPDMHLELAEALINPIQYQSKLEKRTHQLQVLLEDDQDEVDVTAVEDNNKKALPPPPSEEESSSPAVVPKQTDDDGQTKDVSPVAIKPPPVSAGTSPLPKLPKADSTSSKPPVVKSKTEESDLTFSILDEADTITAQTLSTFLENKWIFDKRQEGEKKLAQLKAKHDKDRPKNRRSKNLFSKFTPPKMGKQGSAGNLSSASDAHAIMMDQEREFQDRYHKQVWNKVEELLQKSQQEQLRQLDKLYLKQLEESKGEREKQYSDLRKKNLKAISDRSERDRLKREAMSQAVERRIKDQNQLDEKKNRIKEKLEQEHKNVQQQLEHEKAQEWERIEKEWQERKEKFLESSEGFGSEKGPLGQTESSPL